MILLTSPATVIAIAGVHNLNAVNTTLSISLDIGHMMMESDPGDTYETMSLYDCLQEYKGFGFGDDHHHQTRNLQAKIYALPASWVGNQYILFLFSIDVPPVAVEPRVRVGKFPLLVVE